MEKVIYSEYEFSKTKICYELKEKGEAEFMGIGVDRDEYENGVGSYSTAILKLPCGQVKTVPIEQIRFIDGK